MAGKTAELGFYLATAKRVRAAFCRRNSCRNRCKRWLIRMLHQHWTIPKGAPINLIANVEPDFGQCCFAGKNSESIAEDSHAESFIGTSHRRIDQWRSLNCSRQISAAFCRDKGHYFAPIYRITIKRVIEYLKTLIETQSSEEENMAITVQKC